MQSIGKVSRKNLQNNKVMSNHNQREKKFNHISRKKDVIFEDADQIILLCDCAVNSI